MTRNVCVWGCVGGGGGGGGGGVLEMARKLTLRL